MLVTFLSVHALANIEEQGKGPHIACSVCLIQQGDIEHQDAVPALVNMLLKPLPALTVHQGMHNALQLLHCILHAEIRYQGYCCAQPAVHPLTIVMHRR